MFNIFKGTIRKEKEVSQEKSRADNENICETEIEGINYFVGRRGTAKR